MEHSVCVCVSLSLCVLWRRQRNDAAINDVLAVFVNMTSDPTSLSANQISAIVDALQNVVDSVAAKPEQVNLSDCVTLYWRLFAHIDWACDCVRFCFGIAGIRQVVFDFLLAVCTVVTKSLT